MSGDAHRPKCGSCIHSHVNVPRSKSFSIMSRHENSLQMHKQLLERSAISSLLKGHQMERASLGRIKSPEMGLWRGL